MKKVKIGLGIFGALLGVVAAAAAMQPDQIHLERKITIAASATDMQPFAQDLAKVNEWSPWVEKDPNAKHEYSDETSGVGAWYTWNGNEEVGSGKMSVTVAEDGNVVHHLEFYEPFTAVADATITTTVAGDEIEVTWSFDQNADFGTKMMTLFMSFEDMLGPDYEKGLANLKPLVETAAKERLAAEGSS